MRMELSPLRSDDSRLGPPPFGRILKSPLDLTTPYGNDQHDHGQQLMHHVSLRGRRPQEGWTDVGVLHRAV